MSNQIEELANLIKNSNRAIILTGAGISTDSGLPDFRSDNGFWKSNKPGAIFRWRWSMTGKSRPWPVP